MLWTQPWENTFSLTAVSGFYLRIAIFELNSNRKCERIVEISFLAKLNSKHTELYEYDCIYIRVYEFLLESIRTNFEVYLHGFCTTILMWSLMLLILLFSDFI